MAERGGSQLQTDVVSLNNAVSTFTGTVEPKLNSMNTHYDPLRRMLYGDKSDGEISVEFAEKWLRSRQDSENDARSALAAAAARGDNCEKLEATLSQRIEETQQWRAAYEQLLREVVAKEAKEKVIQSVVTFVLVVLIILALYSELT